MSEVVAVTGVGLVTPLGWSREATWARVCDGRSGIRPLQPAVAEPFGCHFAGGVELPPGEVDRCPSKTHAMALRAAREAVAAAGLTTRERDGLPIMLGNNAAELTLEDKRRLLRDGGGDGTLAEFTLTAWLGTELGVQGPVATLASNCVGGVQAIILGALRIATGRDERVLVGGVDCAVTPEMLARFTLLRALTASCEPSCSRPFDAARTGMVLADGAGFLVLESQAAAHRRGARPLARIGGWGMTSDSHHLTRGAPEGRSKAGAIQQALARARLVPNEVDLVSAHGTGTVDNDATEVRALRLALGARAEGVAVTAAKSALGHALAGSGAVETALAVLTLRDHVVPPILNLEAPGRECDLGGLLRARMTLRPRAILKNAFAFGGFNACLALQPPPESGVEDGPRLGRVS